MKRDPSLGRMRISPTHHPGYESIRMWDVKDVHQQFIKDRPVVFLDTNIWIDLLEQKVDHARECVQLASELVESHKVAFPLSWSTVSELFDHPVRETALEQASLMDRLSHGVGFRAPKEIEDLEVWAACPTLLDLPPDDPPADSVYSFVSECFGTVWLQILRGLFPTKAAMRHFVEKDLIVPPETLEPMRSLRWMIEHSQLNGERAREFRAQQKQRYAERIDSNREALAEKHWSDGKKPSFATFLRIERETMLKGEIGKAMGRALLARFPDRTLELMADEGAMKRGLIKGRMDPCFSAMPHVQMFCEVFAARDLDKSSRTKPNDFHDNSIATIGGSYCDAVATRDSNLRDLLRNRCRLPKARSCTVLSNVDELYEFLQRVT